MRTNVVPWVLMIVLTGCGGAPRGEGGGSIVSRTRSATQKPKPARSAARRPLLLSETEKRLEALHELLSPRGGGSLEVTSLIRRFVDDRDNDLKYEGRGEVLSFPVNDVEGRPLALLLTFRGHRQTRGDDGEEDEEYLEYEKWRSWLVHPSAGGKRPMRLLVSALEEVVHRPTKIESVRWPEGGVLITFTYKAKYDSSCCDDRAETKGDGGDLSEGVGEALVLLYGGVCYSLISHILEQERVTGWGMRVEKVEYRWVRVKGSLWPYLYYERRHLTTSSVPSEEASGEKMEQHTTCERKTELLRLVIPLAADKEVLTPLTSRQIQSLAKKSPLLVKFPAKLSSFKEPQGVCGVLD